MPRTIAFDVELHNHAQGGPTEVVTVDIPQDQQSLAEGGLEGMLQIAGGIADRAIAALAERTLGQPSSWSEQQRKMATAIYARGLGIQSIRRSGETSVFEVDAQYDDGQPYADDVSAVDSSDAAFQVAMAMARNSGSSSTNREAFEDMLQAMSGIVVHWAKPIGATRDDLVSMLAKLYAAVQAGETNDAMTETRSMLEACEALPERVPSPRA